MLVSIVSMYMFNRRTRCENIKYYCLNRRKLLSHLKLKPQKFRIAVSEQRCLRELFDDRNGFVDHHMATSYQTRQCGFKVHFFDVRKRQYQCWRGCSTKKKAHNKCLNWVALLLVSGMRSFMWTYFQIFCVPQTYFALQTPCHLCCCYYLFEKNMLK